GGLVDLPHARTAPPARSAFPITSLSANIYPAIRIFRGPRRHAGRELGAAGRAVAKTAQAVSATPAAPPSQAAVQFSTLRPGILSNSRTLVVTSIARAERAWAPIRVSRAPIGVPSFSRWLRTFP